MAFTFPWEKKKIQKMFVKPIKPKQNTKAKVTTRPVKKAGVAKK